VPRHQTPRLNLRVNSGSHSSLPAGDNQTFVVRENALARNAKARSDQPYDIFLVSDDTRAPVRALYLRSTQTYQAALVFIEHTIKAGGFAHAQPINNIGRHHPHTTARVYPRHDDQGQDR
jgi:hypothetical protein